MSVTSPRRRALSGRKPPEHGTQHGVRPVGQRDRAPARVLDANRPLIALSIDLDRDAHGRARPAVDERPVTLVGPLTTNERSPLRVSPLGRARAEPQPDRADRRPWSV